MIFKIIYFEKMIGHTNLQRMTYNIVYVDTYRGDTEIHVYGLLEKNIL